MEYSFATSLIDIAVIYAIVIVVSLLVAVVIKVIVMTLSRQAERTAAALKLQPAAAADAAVTGLPAHHVQAIAAAVAAMTGAHRVVRIEPKGPSYGWTATARTLHHGSHQPRRR